MNPEQQAERPLVDRPAASASNGAARSRTVSRERELLVMMGLVVGFVLACIIAVALMHLAT